MIPVTIIGGYLGAGKTTLVNHLLRTADGLRLAVLVNDFGDLGIDASLIEGETDGVLSIAGGCVCCSIGSDLMAALHKLAAIAPEQVLIETSGVAMPGPVAAAVRLVPGFAVDGIAVLADAETVRTRAADRYMGDTITRQLAQADLVVLNKSDLVPGGDLAGIHAWLHEQAPQARALQTDHARVPRDVLLGGGLAVCRPDGGNGSMAAGFLEDANSRYASLSIPLQEAVDVRALVRELERPGLGILRAKGLLRDLSGDVLALQGVGARYVTGAVKAAPAGLVCIGLKQELARETIQGLVSRRPTGS